MALPLVVLPEVLDVCLGQLSVRPVSLLPLLEPPSQDADPLRNGRLLALLSPSNPLYRARIVSPRGAVGRLDGPLAQPRLPLADVPQRGARPPLFGEGAVEDDGPGVLELAQEGGQPLFELVRRDPAGASDVPADVVCRGGRFVSAKGRKMCVSRG